MASCGKAQSLPLGSNRMLRVHDLDKLLVYGKREHKKASTPESTFTQILVDKKVNKKIKMERKEQKQAVERPAIGIQDH